MDVLNNYALTKLAYYILGLGPLNPILQYHLFGNEETVTVDSVPSDFDDIDAPGYAPIQLVPGQWDVSTVAGITNASYPQLIWNLTGPGSAPGIIYGHYVYDDGGAGILWGQNWPTPFVIPANGATVTISPSWQDSQCSYPSGVALPFQRGTRDRISNRRRK